MLTPSGSVNANEMLVCAPMCAYTIACAHYERRRRAHECERHMSHNTPPHNTHLQRRIEPEQRDIEQFKRRLTARHSDVAIDLSIYVDA
jgi:hypothetical protein